MGWTFKNLDNEGDLYSSRDDPDLSQTAFGDVVDIPSDFVAPTSTSSSRRTRHKSTNDPSRTYRKRATGPTATSSAKTHPGDSRSSKSMNRDTYSSSRSMKSPTQSKKRAHKSSSTTAKPKSEPIDFVYDINVRRRLREQLDAERRRVLQEAKAREAQLRAENKWVFDKRDKSPPRRKQAWQPSSSPDKNIPNLDGRNQPTDDGSSWTSSRSSRCSSKPHIRAASAPNKRSSSNSVPSSTSSCRTYTPSVTHHHPNVHDAKDTADDVEAAIHEFERRLQTHWGFHVDSK